MQNNLGDRAIIEISGDDRKKFLQGLITNDINKATDQNLIYCAMLNASGRFLCDLFIFEVDETLFLDCFLPRRDEIFTKLNFYKLRSKVEIKKNDTLKVTHSFLDGHFPDPRNREMGFRTYSTNHSSYSDNSYLAKRIELKIPESEHDLTYEKSFILEFDFDNLNAVDYNKGCYVGQELTARTHHLGEIRKKIFHVKISDKTEVAKNSEISCHANPAGLILSSCLINSELHALALIRLPANQNFDDFAQKLELEDHKETVANPKKPHKISIID